MKAPELLTGAAALACRKGFPVDMGQEMKCSLAPGTWRPTHFCGHPLHPAEVLPGVGGASGASFTHAISGVPVPPLLV